MCSGTDSQRSQMRSRSPDSSGVSHYCAATVERRAWELYAIVLPELRFDLSVFFLRRRRWSVLQLSIMVSISRVGVVYANCTYRINDYYNNVIGYIVSVRGITGCELPIAPPTPNLNFESCKYFRSVIRLNRRFVFLST